MPLENVKEGVTLFLYLMVLEAWLPQIILQHDLNQPKMHEILIESLEPNDRTGIVLFDLVQQLSHISLLSRKKH